jgi:hypothetical protein
MRYFTLLFLAGLLWGCPSPDFIDIEPGHATLKQKNNSVWFKAKVRAHNGTEFPKAVVGWASKDPQIVAVDEKGRVTPLKSGSTEIVATYRGLTASVPVEVLFAERMEVKPNPLELAEHGEAVDLEVLVYDHRGRLLRDRTPTFKSLDSKVLTMGRNAAHPGQAGTAAVEVRVEELMQTVDVKVGKAKQRK